MQVKLHAMGSASNNLQMEQSMGANHDNVGGRPSQLVLTFSLYKELHTQTIKCPSKLQVREGVNSQAL